MTSNVIFANKTDMELMSLNLKWKMLEFLEFIVFEQLIAIKIVQSHCTYNEKDHFTSKCVQPTTNVHLNAVLIFDLILCWTWIQKLMLNYQTWHKYRFVDYISNRTIFVLIWTSHHFDNSTIARNIQWSSQFYYFLCKKKKKQIG